MGGGRGYTPQGASNTPAANSTTPRAAVTAGIRGSSDAQKERCQSIEDKATVAPVALNGPPVGRGGR
jgi:hypothetical protein